MGLMAYLDPKGDGDKSMPGKQRSCSGVGGDALRDPRDMAKAGLPESQSPDDASSRPPERRLSRPGFVGDSQPCEGGSHASTEEVPGRGP
jgi:hypothetical protein